MSHLLWKYYLEDNVDRFRSLLANGYTTSPYASKSHGSGAGQNGSVGAIGGSPGATLGTSPRTTMKNRKSSGFSHSSSGLRSQNNVLGRMELNTRDQSGLTILHRAVSSAGANAVAFALALIENPSVDIYIQDLENGWTALHRALYFGNVTIARALMERDSRDSMGHGVNNAVFKVNALIKIKDHEGNSAFDVYNATIARRTLEHRGHPETVSGFDDEDEDSEGVRSRGSDNLAFGSIDADEIFAFGSNKNLTLGFGDGDDRQHPEKIHLRRPDHLLYRFHREHLHSRYESGEAGGESPYTPVPSVSDLPALIRNRPIIIQDVTLSKLHSAILTTDPESNLYMCGFGPGGRLGTGDEKTSFNYVCIEGGGLAGKKIVAIALGQNHSIAVSSEGEVFTWGTNNWGQLGYSLPRPVLQDEEPINSTPRQIFGTLKREIVLGVAASGIHSVAFTANSLYTWGKNEGQLGLMDSDSRSLEAQIVPRRVAASLFTSSIQMVSAINRATVCLLCNHSVYVFTNYGYNNVKFPMYDGFTNYHLSNTALTTRYKAEPSHISYVTSGGDTIAAISSRGDLFTVNVSQKLDPSPAATSTTNPAKIRNALSQPQHVWSLRKGHWDGIKSVGVAENGAVIICTQAGAVWRRVRRAKIKDTYISGTGESKNKDYKFQRVPGLTKVAAVRSNTFGGYAALRKDCDITRTQIIVHQQDLWKDLAPLFSLSDFRPPEPLERLEKLYRFWQPTTSDSNCDTLKRAVLVSPELETAVLHHVQSISQNCEEYDTEVSTSLSRASIPVHGFMLAARSPALRDALWAYRNNSDASNTDTFAISGEKKLEIMFHGVDFLTVLNLVFYMYTDRVVDVWHFTRYAPTSAFRYRQIRVELMRLAARLGMGKLESAVRLMSEPKRTLNFDLAVAFEDPRFFADADAVVELDGGSLSVHSTLIRQRCSFFEGLFNGRAAGQWLAGRRQTDSEAIKIDMKHINPSTFKLVLRYIYTDVGTELFDDIVSADIDEFCDVVMDVMSTANELMLNRLSQTCQQVIGRFVNIRNICHLLNAVAPCAVTEFKNAGLEYLCLQLEAMLENHLLDDLDEDLLLELDDVVRSNQLACLPFAKSDRAEKLLHEQYPNLAGDIDEERQRKARDLTFRSSIRDDESRLSSSFRTRVGSLDDTVLSSPLQEKSRRKSKTSQNAPFSPAIRPKDSAADLMFSMDDEDSTTLGNQTSPCPKPIDWVENSKNASHTPTDPRSVFHENKGKDIVTGDTTPHASPNTPALTRSTSSPRVAVKVSNSDGSSLAVGSPWAPALLPSSKLDMREIMAQASRGRTSTLSMSLSAEKAKAATPKMSQKERKRKQQQALQQTTASIPPVMDGSSLSAKPLIPWQLPNSGHKISLKDVLGIEAKSSSSIATLKPPLSPIPVLTHNHRRTASPDTRFAGQRRSGTSTPVNKSKEAVDPNVNLSRPVPQPSALKSGPLVSHPKIDTNPTERAEPPLQLSLADIIGQQRLEQDFVKEAVAKRSLQEIQEEQAFQEWWDQESRRAQEEEAARLKSGSGSVVDRNMRGKGGRRGRGSTHRGRGDTGQGRGHGRGRGRGGSEPSGKSAN